VAEEEAAPPAGESAPAPQAEPEAPAAEATLPEASVVEGEYSTELLFFLSTTPFWGGVYGLEN
jgi:hypothetical protein